MYSVSDVKLGELKHYKFNYINNVVLDVIGVCVDVAVNSVDEKHSTFVFYGYTPDGKTYNGIKFKLADLLEIKSIRLPANDKSRDYFSILYEEYKKIGGYRSKIKEAEAKVQMLHSKYIQQVKKVDGCLSQIMNKRGIMPIAEFTGLIAQQLEAKLSNNYSKSYSSIDVNIDTSKGKYLDISVALRVGRYDYDTLIDCGICYKEYDYTVWTNSYSKIKNIKLVKSWVENNKVYWNISKFGATEYHSIDVGDKCTVYVITGVRIPIKKDLSKSYANEIASNILY